MSKALSHALPKLNQWEPKFPFDLVIAYDDATTRTRAMQLYDQLAQQLLEDYDFQCSWWRIEHFLNPVLSEQAAQAAAQASMIILSLRGDRPLPPMLKAWLPRWLDKKGDQKSALVLLLCADGQPGDEAHYLESYLRQVAEQARMDFFAHAYPLSTELADLANNSSAVARRTQTIAPLFEEFLDQPAYIPRWGINE
jgi:hypothetical protein